MESREKLLQRLEEAQANAMRMVDGPLANPSAIMLQQGANAPIVTTALVTIAEVLIDMRENSARMTELLWEVRAIARGLNYRWGLRPEDVPTVEIGNEDRIKELLDEGALPGFEDKGQ